MPDHNNTYMKNLSIFLLIFWFSASTLKAQNQDFIQIDSNKTLSLFSFLETATSAQGTSVSYKNFIIERLGENPGFNAVIDRYLKLNLEYYFERSEFPSKRYSFTTIKDMAWITASNSSSIDDFSERMIGFLPHNKHVEFISLLKETEAYFDAIVWTEEKERIKRIMKQLEPYKSKIEELYFQVTKFYGTSWDRSIPFRIILNPIPLDSGVSTAIPKGNALICSFLSKNENDYKGVLGVIIHEMCHILYDAQPVDMQEDIDRWFKESKSEYRKLAYSYINEGLATTLGNGWAYEKIFGEIDTTEWYSNRVINGFAHSLFDLTKSYIDYDRTIDESYIIQAVELYEVTFPEAIDEVELLLSEMYLFANSEEEENVIAISDEVRGSFDIRSQTFSTPLYDPRSIESFSNANITKMFIIEKDHEKSYQALQHFYSDDGIRPRRNSIYSFKDKQTESPIIILDLKSIDDLKPAIKALKDRKYLTYNKNNKF